MLTFRNAKFRYDPYPIGLATDVFAPEAYAALRRTYPPEALFLEMKGHYNKSSLAEKNHPEAYFAFLRGSPEWKAFYAYVKSPLLIQDLYPCLKAAGINPPKDRLSARFEFSSLPADGGGIDPHTDIPSKILTLIMPMVKPGEWDASFGGETDVLRPLDPWRLYRDYQEPRKDFELVDSYAYAPNQCVIFIKTLNSWHSVGPIQGPVGLWRRTVTLNIERGA